MILRFAVPVLSVLVLSACGSVGPPPQAISPPRPIALTGLERVIGKDARSLILLFGTPDQDVREEKARKLQFASAVCVLDAYLYPPAAGREPIVTFLDARLPNGDDVDRASCVAALSRRKEAR
jgi:hypothetical protein